MLAVIIAVSGISFCVFQIAGNLLTGRLQRKFNQKLWPKHEEIIPILPKLLHAAHAISIVALSISGIYIRFPFYADGYATMLQIHYYFMYPVVVTFVLRVYYAILKDVKEFSVRPSEVRNSHKVILYYTFVKSSYPHLAKYNILQKMTYSILFPFLMVVLAVSGFSLMWPQILLRLFAGLFGSVPTVMALVIVIHWMAAISIMIMTTIHVCLAFVEDYPTLLVFFGLSKQQKVICYEKTNEHI